MDIRITDQLTRGQLRDLKKLYRSAFPASEKKPFWLIKMKKRAGITDILGLLDENNRLVGEIITIAWRDLLLVDYFAIAEQVRGQGCGTRALELLRERYNDRRILLEIEATQVSCGNLQQRMRRKQFYLSCGFDSMDYHVDLFGVEMEIMTLRGRRVSFAEYHEIFTGVYGRRFARRVSLMEHPHSEPSLSGNIQK